IVQWLEKYISQSLESKISKKFNHYVACYYGCLLVRPPKILQFDRCEDPQSMDKIMSQIGATPIEWAFKTECCGAGLSVSRTDIVAKLSGKIINDAVIRGAQAIIVVCPMCHSNLDMRRPEINNYLNKQTDIPILYLTQAIGLTLGIKEKELGLQRHFVPVILKEKPVEQVKAKEKTKKETVAEEVEEQ
ncbi:MAG: hypothetical protein HY738_12945, partial [Bacteroidia bacterium]|nr:hypothetical protein [Bacteroidia bacterium]